MTRRRQWLARMLKLLTVIGLVFASVPFISQLIPDNPTVNDVLRRWQVEIELTDLAPGQLMLVRDWPGGPVAVYHRRQPEISRPSDEDTGLHDPGSRFSRQPDALRTRMRSHRPAYFVFIPRDTVRQCRVRYIGRDKPPAAGIDWRGGFGEPCLGSLYDTAGRVYADHRAPGQENLPVPPHRFIGQTRIQLQPWSGPNEG